MWQSQSLRRYAELLAITHVNDTLPAPLVSALLGSHTQVVLFVTLCD